MNRSFITATALIGVTTAALASGPVPKEELMTPPESATRYIIVSDTNTHGDEWRWETEEGKTAFRKSQSLRGWITETDALAEAFDEASRALTYTVFDPRSLQS